MHRTFRCELCGEEVHPGWTDEAARKEYEQLFGTPLDLATMAVVCDRCFNNMKPMPLPW